MNYVLRPIFELLSLQKNELFYVIIGSMLTVGFVFLIFLIISYFIIKMGFIKPVKENEYFEYDLRKKYVQAIIFTTLCFLISVEIIVGWKSGSIDSGKMNFYIPYIPLWAGFIFSGIMALVYAYPIKRRLNDLRKIEQKINQ